MDAIQTLLERYPVLCSQEEPLREAAKLLCACGRSGGKVLTCGNGGSASDAEHVVGELMKDFKMRRPIREETRQRLAAVDEAPQDLMDSLQEAVSAICLNSHTSLLTALCNDGDPAMIFAQQVYGYFWHSALRGIPRMCETPFGLPERWECGPFLFPESPAGPLRPWWMWPSGCRKRIPTRSRN